MQTKAPAEASGEARTEVEGWTACTTYTRPYACAFLQVYVPNTTHMAAAFGSFSRTSGNELGMTSPAQFRMCVMPCFSRSGRFDVTLTPLTKRYGRISEQTLQGCGGGAEGRGSGVVALVSGCKS